MFKRVLLPLALAVALLGPVACVHTSVTLPQNVQVASKADKVVIRLGELEKFVIQANSQGALSDAVSIKVVKFCVDGAKIAKDTPTGWNVALTHAWELLKSDVPLMSSPALLPYTASLDILLASL